MITFENYITASGSYPERLKNQELTDELISNANVLISKLNAFLNELGVHDVKISSGFRPSSVNKNVPNAAKKSYHELCMACDIVDDKNQTLAKSILVRPDLLRKYELWIEDPKSTIGKNTNWVHLDYGNRADRSLRLFIP